MKYLPSALGANQSRYLTLARAAEQLGEKEEHILFALIQPDAAAKMEFAEVTGEGGCILVPRSEMPRIETFLSRPGTKKLIARSEEQSEREGQRMKEDAARQ